MLNKCGLPKNFIQMVKNEDEASLYVEWSKNQSHLQYNRVEFSDYDLEESWNHNKRWEVSG